MNSDDIVGTWIGISHKSIIVVTYKKEGTFSGSLKTPEADYNALFEGKWNLKENILYSTYLKSSGSKFPVPMNNKDMIIDFKKNYMIAKGQNNNTVIFTRVHYHRPSLPKSEWSITPPLRLTTEFYTDANSLEDIDDELWTYLCDLLPRKGTYRDCVQQMLNDISPELRRYYLTRSFDWERGSGGLESCMMRDDDDLFLKDTIKAYEDIGAKRHAEIIKQLIPIAEKRKKEIAIADAEGREFDFDKNDPFEPFEKEWDKASEEYFFYEYIFRDMKKYPEKYTHPNLKKIPNKANAADAKSRAVD